MNKLAASTKIYHLRSAARLPFRPLSDLQQKLYSYNGMSRNAHFIYMYS